MGVNIGGLASVVSKVTGAMDVGSLLNGIDINNISPESISGIKGTIEGKLNGMASSMMGSLTSSVNASDIEGMLGNIDIESQVNDLMKSKGLDGSIIDESQIQSMVDNVMNLSDINIM